MDGIEEKDTFAASPEDPDVPKTQLKPGAIVELAMERLDELRADETGQRLDEFLRAHATSSPVTDRQVRRSIEYLLMLKGWSRTA